MNFEIYNQVKTRIQKTKTGERTLQLFNKTGDLFIIDIVNQGMTLTVYPGSADYDGTFDIYHFGLTFKSLMGALECLKKNKEYCFQNQFFMRIHNDTLIFSFLKQVINSHVTFFLNANGTQKALRFMTMNLKRNH